MSECISSLYKSVKHNAANSVNRLILKKSRHIGFVVFIVHSSMGGSHGPPLEGKESMDTF
jgi:hypothetical protein